MGIGTGTGGLQKQIGQKPIQFLRDLGCQRNHNSGLQTFFDSVALKIIFGKPTLKRQKMGYDSPTSFKKERTRPCSPVPASEVEEEIV